MAWKKYPHIAIAAMATAIRTAVDALLSPECEQNWQNQIGVRAAPWSEQERWEYAAI